MNKLSEKFKDRPQSPQDTLVYWVEYVLRHQNTSFLRPAGSKLPLYQYLLLDIILFLLVILCSVIWFLRMLLKFTCSIVKMKCKKSRMKTD